MSSEHRRDVASDPGTSTVLVDSHVHVHPRFDEARFLRAAFRNFSKAADALQLGAGWRGVMVLTEIAGADRFSQLLAEIGAAVGDGWTVESTSEDTSVRLRNSGDPAVMTVVAGRQVQTKEGLEVLAFPHRGPILDGRPIREVILEADSAGAVSLVPWGFGKWWGRRGRTVRALLTEEPGLPFLLADTGHRPAWAPRPQQLVESERRGRPTLTGSDPLPLNGEESRPGSCCVRLTISSFSDQPALRLKEAIAALNDSPPRYEQRVGLTRFTTSQLAMQVRKRTR